MTPFLARNLRPLPVVGIPEQPTGFDATPRRPDLVREMHLRPVDRDRRRLAHRPDPSPHRPRTLSVLSRWRNSAGRAVLPLLLASCSLTVNDAPSPTIPAVTIAQAQAAWCEEASFLSDQDYTVHDGQAERLRRWAEDVERVAEMYQAAGSLDAARVTAVAHGLQGWADALDRELPAHPTAQDIIDKLDATNDATRSAVAAIERAPRCTT